MIPGPVMLPGGYIPRDNDFDGRYEDLNGNQRLDFQDVIILFENLGEIGAHPEWTAYFDFSENGRTDFADVTGLFSLI